MKVRALLLAVAVGPCAAADPVDTPARAFQAGKDFANSSRGKGKASSAVRATSAPANVPNYNLNPPERGLFNNGQNLLSGAGNAKVAACKTDVAPSAYLQQECNTVNWLNSNQGRSNRFFLDRQRDPLVAGSTVLINEPGSIPDAGQSSCQVMQKTVRGVGTTETCEESTVLSSFLCRKTAVPRCSVEGAPIRSHEVMGQGPFQAPTLTPTGNVGEYTYRFHVPRSCGAEGEAFIKFELDTVGQGGSLTLRLEQLDDTAAVAINDTTVFAGHPNSGPVYSNDFFPMDRKDFAIGYSWDEDVGGPECQAFDGDGNCTSSVFVPNVQRFFANTKLLDTCPAGWVPTSMRDLQPGRQPLNYTPDVVGGFFCNAQGRMLLNKVEGINNWAGVVNAAMPLQIGGNTIRVYWGTAGYGRACGNVTVTGTIKNVAPRCIVEWDDRCADARTAVGP